MAKEAMETPVPTFAPVTPLVPDAEREAANRATARVEELRREIAAAEAEATAASLARRAAEEQETAFAAWLNDIAARHVAAADELMSREITTPAGWHALAQEVAALRRSTIREAERGGESPARNNAARHQIGVIMDRHPLAVVSLWLGDMQPRVA